jgi:hypothetical protein
MSILQVWRKKKSEDVEHFCKHLQKKNPKLAAAFNNGGAVVFAERCREMLEATSGGKKLRDSILEKANTKQTPPPTPEVFPHNLEMEREIIEYIKANFPEGATLGLLGEEINKVNPKWKGYIGKNGKMKSFLERNEIRIEKRGGDLEIHFSKKGNQHFQFAWLIIASFISCPHCSSS